MEPTCCRLYRLSARNFILEPELTLSETRQASLRRYAIRMLLTCSVGAQMNLSLSCVAVAEATLRDEKTAGDTTENGVSKGKAPSCRRIAPEIICRTVTKWDALWS